MSEKIDINTLTDFFINSVDENEQPKWTEEHLSELLYNFDVYEKDEADKMFEELGYEKDFLIMYNFMILNHQFEITFDSNYKDYFITEYYYDERGIFQTRKINIDDTSYDVAKAINKKCEELGWK